MSILPAAFYRRSDARQVAMDLVGKVVVTDLEGGVSTARIVETEAYMGVSDRASHAFGGRFTERTRVMYESGGVAYVYLCYGMHHLFNVVTHMEGVPHAVLIRAAEPMEGIALMFARTGCSGDAMRLCSGPGKFSRAMGVTTALTGASLQSNAIHIIDDGWEAPAGALLSTPRIGVDYAGEDASLPYRYIVQGHRSLSGRRVDNIVL